MKDLDRVVGKMVADRKCHVMHMGKNNLKNEYWLGLDRVKIRLEITKSEKYL